MVTNAGNNGSNGSTSVAKCLGRVCQRKTSRLPAAVCLNPNTSHLTKEELAAYEKASETTDGVFDILPEEALENATVEELKVIASLIMRNNKLKAEATINTLKEATRNSLTVKETAQQMVRDIDNTVGGAIA